MDRIEIDVITSERKVVELTAEEVAQAQAQYAEWLAAQPTLCCDVSFEPTASFTAFDLNAELTMIGLPSSKSLTSM